VIAVLGFVLGIFGGGESVDSPSPRSGAPVIESVAYVPPSRIDAAGTSGPVSDGNAIYLVARRPDDGQLVASTAAQLSRSAAREGELHWRALLDLETGTLGSAIQSDDRAASYEVVAAVAPEVRSAGDEWPASVTSASAGTSSGGIDIDDAEVVSPPELVTVR
jgi:hypothetical protein